MDSLRRFDLNLLVAFDILVAERSVTAAARRMAIGQPAMSNALSRLRDMFNDPLLIRTSSGLQPTGQQAAADVQCAAFGFGQEGERESETV